MNNINPKEIREKAVRAILKDGLTDIMIGILLLVISLYFYLEVYYQINIVMLLIFPGILVGPLLMSLRKKYTYPRTGYVNLKTKKVRTLKLSLAIFGVFSGLIVFYIFYNRSAGIIDKILPYFGYLPLLIGIVLFFIYVYQAVRYKLNRYYIYTIVAAASILYALSVTDKRIVSFILMLFIQGIFLLPVGCYTFWKFLRKNPVPAESDTEEEMDNDNQIQFQKALAITISDGWQEILTACFLLVWMIIILVSNLNVFWLYSTLILNPLFISLILNKLRKTRTFQLTMELTDSRIDLISFASSFYFFFMFSLGIFAVLSLKDTFEVRNYVSFLPAILAAVTGLYYLISAVKYKIVRFKYYALIFLLAGISSIILTTATIHQLTLILLVPSILFFGQGIKYRIRAR